MVSFLSSAYFVIALVVFSTFASCAHQSRPERLQKLKLGTDKSVVVEQFGSPTQTLRRDEADHWIYRFYQDNEEYYTVLIFSVSKLVFVAQPKLVLERSNVDLLNELYEIRNSKPPE